MSTPAFILAVVCMLLLWSAVAVLALIAGHHQTFPTPKAPATPRQTRRRRRRPSPTQDHTSSTTVDHITSGLEDATSTAQSKT